MTLVLGTYGPKSIWLLTDRRLSYRGRPPRDDARKSLVLDATDGLALLGYAGLGATALGTEPSDWMARVVRGRNLRLEQYLGLIADAIQRKFPPHLKSLKGSPHHVIVPAFLNGEGRLYVIDLTRTPQGPHFLLRFTRFAGEKEIKLKYVARRIAIGGSGVLPLMSDQKWARELVRIVKAHDDGKLSPRSVASYLAEINYRVHSELGRKGDNSVGPRCIISYRFQQGGGGQEFFDGVTREENAAVRLPTMSVGMDINDLAQTTIPHVMRMFEAFRRGEAAEIDKDAINADLARLPQGPDETLD